MSEIGVYLPRGFATCAPGWWFWDGECVYSEGLDRRFGITDFSDVPLGHLLCEPGDGTWCPLWFYVLEAAIAERLIPWR